MAYPILYKANETNFEHLGVSVLSDASKCHVSREKNGIYILEFDYPVNGKDVDKIKEGMYIKSDAGYRTKNQRFVISKITKTQNEFKIYCQHISQVKTTMNAIRPDITLTNVSAMGALTAWRDNLLDSREEFFVQSDIGTLNSTTWKVENIENARDALGGKAGSILDVWGGEYEFDNLNITLHKSMGIDNPTIIAYGKNLLDLEQEQSILETYTSVFPFKKYTDDNNREQLITLPEILLDSTHLNKFTHRRILKVDFSSDENLKTVEQLRSKAKSYIKNNNVGVPKTNLKINYQDLSKVEGVFDNPALEQIDLCDRLKVYYSELGILNENAKVVKVIWDVILEENHEIEVGDGRSSFTDSTSAKIETLQAQNDSVIARINALVAEQDAAFDRYFNEKSKVIEDKVKGGYEKALLSSEEKIRKMGEAFDEKVNQFRNQVSTTVENYNRQFQATNLEISKNRVEATKQIQALTDRVNNIQDISNNETVRELRGLVNGATSKVTELQDSITREFTAVKKKNEDGLNAVKAEFTKGVNGLTSKISSLEEYKNQDGTRTESLKQWVQRDTASQLSRERTEINRIIDNKGFVKNTEFSSKFTESARGITNQLSALENYKNQDGARTANLQIWAQNNTANQLTAARRSIESWVNEKGYATTSVVENKVQETANSFSREISNVRNSIPTSVGGRNRALKTTKDWGDFISVESGIGSNIRIPLHTVLADGLKAGDKLLVSMEYSIDNVVRFNNNSMTAKFQGLGDVTEWSATGVPFFQNIGELSTGDNYRVAKFEVVLNSEMVKNNYWNLEIRVDGARSCKAHTKKCKIEVGNIYTDWTPAPEDVEQNVNELNTWKQTANQTLNTVTSTLNDTVRHSQLRVGADKIDFGSNQVFDGRNLASMLSVSPESINAITDKLVITPSNENLVRVNQRESITSSERDTFITDDIKEDLSDGAEFYFKAKFSSNGRGKQRIGIHIYVTYTDNSQSWGFTEMFPINSYAWSEERTATLKFEKTAGKKVKHYAFGIHQSAWNDFSSWTIKGLELYKKKSAELIVDGSIEGRQIKTETLETGHHKAGSITSEIIAAKAVKVNNLLVDDAMIQEFVAHKAFISKLWAQDAFIKSLQTVKISATQLDTDWLSAYTGDIGGFRIGKNPNQPGDFWLTGSNNFNCGLNPGHNIGTRGAQIWAAWGNNWNRAGSNAWWVDGQGRMNCKNSATFYGGLHVYNARLDTHGQDIQGDANSNGAKTTVIWWSQINRVKSSVSDKRFKTNIKPTKVKAVDLLNKIEMVEFNWKKDNKFEKIGAIAQQVQSVEESLVVKDMDSKQSYSDYLRISYYDTIPYLIKAVQELSEENNKLKNKLEELING
ncbi:tail fiber domain-containing protein [Gemella sp. 20925_1_85]|uniref:phage tail spike protein n=1 Tax=Gemella sp. 20925_1_85 TaxID=3003690 RepID=UPI00352E2935